MDDKKKARKELISTKGQGKLTSDQLKGLTKEYLDKSVIYLIK